MHCFLSIMKKKSQTIRDKAISVFKVHGGVLRSSEAIRKGIHPRVLYELLDLGIIEKLQRGLYALTNLLDLEDPDLVVISKVIPNGVICLTSAIYFHRLTVQIPRWIDVAVSREVSPPKIKCLPVQIHWFSEKFYREGIEEYDFAGAKIKIYSREKSIVDCFRLRKKVGIDVAIESLKEYLKQKNININLLIRFAKASRVFQIMQPYIQAFTHDQS